MSTFGTSTFSNRAVIQRVDKRESYTVIHIKVSIKRMHIIKSPIVEKRLNCILIYKALVSFIIPCKLSICNYVILKK